MSSAAEKLKLAKDVYAHLTNVKWTNGTVHGDIEITRESRELLSRLDNEGLLYPTVNVGGRSLSTEELTPKHEGFSAIVELMPPRTDSAFFAEDLNDLFDTLHASKYKAPSAFYIADATYLHRDGQPAGAVAQYLQALDLIALLSDICDHAVLDERMKLIFLQKEKLELVVDYGLQDLHDLSQVGQLRHDLKAAPHEEQKRTILKTVLIERLNNSNIKSDQRFAYLLNHFDEFSDSYSDNYRLYISSFSFEKIREEAEEKKLEYTAKLNKVFTDIQDKLLGIPASVLFVGWQMKQATTTDQMVANTVMLIGAWVVAVLMWMLIQNQKHTLKATKEEIDGLERRYKRKYADQFMSIEVIFTNLNARYQHQQRILRLISGLIIVAVVGAWSLYAYYCFDLAQLYGSIVAWIFQSVIGVFQAVTRWFS